MWHQSVLAPVHRAQPQWPWQCLHMPSPPLHMTSWCTINRCTWRQRESESVSQLVSQCDVWVPCAAFFSLVDEGLHSGLPMSTGKTKRRPPTSTNRMQLSLHTHTHTHTHHHDVTTPSWCIDCPDAQTSTYTHTHLQWTTDYSTCCLTMQTWPLWALPLRNKHTPTNTHTQQTHPQQC